MKKVVMLAFGFLAALLGVEFCIWQFGVESSEERVLNEKLDAFLKSGQIRIGAAELLPLTWETICILPSYTTEQHIESQLQRRLSFMDRLRWHVYWGSDDRFFGFAIVRRDRSVLPLKIWKTLAAIDTEAWPAHCIVRERAVITRQDQYVAVSPTK